MMADEPVRWGTPRIMKAFDEAQMVVFGPPFSGKQREMVGVFTGDNRVMNALLDSLAPELYEILKEIVESEIEPPQSVWNRARALIEKLDQAH